MPGPIDIVYTTIGGVIGAALTQYVTHLRDRRAARALVIERIADVEEAFTTLQLSSPVDGSEPIESSIAGELAALESACLVAGAPRSALTCDTVSISTYAHGHRIQRSPGFIGDKIA
jgi:hypothetical protein